MTTCISGSKMSTKPNGPCDGPHEQSRLRSLYGWVTPLAIEIGYYKHSVSIFIGNIIQFRIVALYFYLIPFDSILMVSIFQVR